MNQVEHSDHKTIANEVFDFYSKLYSSSFSPSNSNSSFQTIINNIPSIDSIFKEVCESEITIQELDAAVKRANLVNLQALMFNHRFLSNILGGPQMYFVGCFTGVYKE